jgi:hypothetical protein
MINFLAIEQKSISLAACTKKDSCFELVDWFSGLDFGQNG